MKTIELTQGRVALVDDDDFEYLNQWKWQYHRGYACRSQRIGDRKIGKRKYFWMHREILKTPDGLFTDHIDRNGLNNQKSNLRVCTKSQNRMNTIKRKDNTVGYKGVRKNRTGWQARLMVNGISVLQKTFHNLQDAIDAYDNTAREYHGEFANVNSSK